MEFWEIILRRSVCVTGIFRDFQLNSLFSRDKDEDKQKYGNKDKTEGDEQNGEMKYKMETKRGHRLIT